MEALGAYDADRGRKLTTPVQRQNSEMRTGGH